MEPSLNVKWQNSNPNRWLLMVNITSTAGNNVNIKIRACYPENAWKSTILLLGELHFYSSHPPSRCTYRWIKEDGKQKDWQESWLLWQQVNEMPKLVKLIARAGVRETSLSYLSCWLLSFMYNSPPLPSISTSSDSRMGTALEWQGNQGR